MLRGRLSRAVGNSSYAETSLHGGTLATCYETLSSDPGLSQNRCTFGICGMVMGSPLGRYKDSLENLPYDDISAQCLEQCRSTKFPGPNIQQRPTEQLQSPNLKPTTGGLLSGSFLKQGPSHQKKPPSMMMMMSMMMIMMTSMMMMIRMMMMVMMMSMIMIMMMMFMMSMIMIMMVQPGSEGSGRTQGENAGGASGF